MNFRRFRVSDYGCCCWTANYQRDVRFESKNLDNGIVNRDVSGLGADHFNDIDLGNAQQIEVVRGPSSLLYTNGAIGGIVNVVDNSIAIEECRKIGKIGLETQSVNDGQYPKHFSIKIT